MYSQSDYMQPNMQNDPWNDNGLPRMNLPSALDFGSAIMPPPPNDLPDTMQKPMYTSAFLAQNIGKIVKVEFLLFNSTIERIGRLVQVGANYIVLQSLDNANIMMGDLYAIKFVTIMNDMKNPMLL